ncbi:MAG: M56 family metallopeptidase, partial [Chloroflexota bacterium]
MQAVVLCLGWFNPLVWLLSRAVHRCREECCDDRILHDRLTSRDVYSETLARIAEYLAHQERRRAAFAFSSSMHPLANRVARVLSPRANRSGRLSTVGMFAITIVGCLVLPGSYREQLTASAAAAKPSGTS